MYVVFLAGGIASGKSTVAQELRRRGAGCVDLDALSREATARGSKALVGIAREFGSDVLDEEGNLRRSVLAQRAFCSEERTRELERIVHPHVRALLREWLESNRDQGVCVVEIPLLDRVEDLVPMADEVLCVTCPVEVRRERAIGRGMDGKDFDARASKQASDAYLEEHGTSFIRNVGTRAELQHEINRWWEGALKRAANPGTSVSICEVADEH